MGLTALTKRIGFVDRPDNPDGELIRYRVCSLEVANVENVYLYLMELINFSSLSCSVGWPSSDSCQYDARGVRALYSGVDKGNMTCLHFFFVVFLKDTFGCITWFNADSLLFNILDFPVACA